MALCPISWKTKFREKLLYLEIIMAFENEKVPEEDIEKYGLREINKKFMKGDFDYRWTMDRERDIYLRWMKYDLQDPCVQQISFFWKGALFRIELKVVCEGERGGKGSTTWSWNGMRRPETPKEQAIWDAYRAEIIADLKDALRAYRDFGIGSVIADHTAYFDF